MAYASVSSTGQVLELLEEDRKFHLHFNRKIVLDELIRIGGKREPIYDELRCGVFGEHNEYDDLVRDPDATAEPPRVDFRVDSRGFIITERSSGNFRLYNAKPIDGIKLKTEMFFFFLISLIGACVSNEILEKGSSVRGGGGGGGEGKEYSSEFLVGVWRPVL